MLNMIFLDDLLESPIQHLMTVPEPYFQSVYQIGWLQAPFAEELFDVVDHSYVYKELALMSKDTDTVYDPYRLSGGTQALLMMYFTKDRFMYDLGMLGDNCHPWLPIACAGDVDIYGILPYPMKIKEVRTPFKCYNDGSIITCKDEYVTAYRKYASSKHEDIDWTPMIAKYGSRF